MKLLTPRSGLPGRAPSGPFGRHSNAYEHLKTVPSGRTVRFVIDLAGFRSPIMGMGQTSTIVDQRDYDRRLSQRAMPRVRRRGGAKMAHHDPGHYHRI